IHWIGMTEAAILKKLRPICMAQPGAKETPMMEHAAFRLNGKIFCILHGPPGQPAIGVKVGKAMLEVFLADPRFYKMPHIGHQGWVSLRGDSELDWQEIGELVQRSYSLVAAKAPAKPRAKKPRS